MNNPISIEADVSEVVEALSGTAQGLTSIKRQAVGIVARGTVKQIKAFISSNAGRITGELAKAYRYKVHKDGSQANVFPKAIHSGNKIVPKVVVQSYGHSGPTKKDRNWDVKAIGFIQAGKAWVESGSYMSDVEKMVDTQLEKYWG